MPRDQAFVDGYSFDAYKAAGFGRADEQDTGAAREAMQHMRKPELEGGIRGWWDYLTSLPKVSPFEPKDLKFGEIPEGVLRLGGTFVVQGDRILYRWSDRLPGDYPNIEEVWKIASSVTVDAAPA